MIKFGRFIVKHRVLVLVCYGAIKKTTHRSILPDVGRLSGGIMKHYRVFILLFLLLVGPAIYGYNHTTVYYNLDSTLPEELDSSRANKSLTEDFKMGALHLLLLDNDRCKNITVDHGMVENDGDHSVVVCYGMPGLTESLALEDTENFEAPVFPSTVELTADVTDFQLQTAITVASAGLHRRSAGWGRPAAGWHSGAEKWRR